LKPFLFLTSSSTSLHAFSTASCLAKAHPLHFLFSKLTAPTNKFSASVCPHVGSPSIFVPPIRKNDSTFLIPHKLESKHERYGKSSVTHYLRIMLVLAMPFLTLANHRVHKTTYIFTSCEDTHCLIGPYYVSCFV